MCSPLPIRWKKERTPYFSLSATSAIRHDERRQPNSSRTMKSLNSIPMVVFVIAIILCCATTVTMAAAPAVTSFDWQPLQPALSGLKVEYRIIALYSRDAGRREANISFNVGQGTQDLGFRNELPVLFTCQPAQPVTFRVRDENGEATTACFIIRD